MNDILERQKCDTILLDAYNLFNDEYAQRIPTCIDTLNNEVPEIFKHYEYPVSSWPVIINSEIAGKLNELSVRLPQLIRQIPALYFGNNVKQIADFYFDGNEMIAEFALMYHLKNIDVGCRLDLTYSENQFKVLEANMGSSIGGWQVQSFEAIIRKLHTPLNNPTTSHNFKSRNTQRIYIEFLVESVLKYVSEVDWEMNVFLCMKTEGNDKTGEVSTNFFNDLLQRELQKRGMVGKVYSGDIMDLKYNNERLLFNGDTIHSVLVFELNDAQTIPTDVYRAFIADKIYFPDHIGVPMLGDKRNLSLLRELAMKKVFGQSDNELILNSVPWTSVIREGIIHYKNEEYGLLDLLKDKKDEFVIKAARGLQGKDVFIGKFSTSEEWEDAIQLAIANKNGFLAQEFSDSMDFLAPDMSNVWEPHKLIWGSFGFGQKYGGVWVRMSAVKTDVGVINSATGAVEALVYEKKPLNQ